MPFLEFLKKRNLQKKRITWERLDKDVDIIFLVWEALLPRFQLKN